jgi:nucleotide-binding universal stress UspA family protein
MRGMADALSQNMSVEHSQVVVGFDFSHSGQAALYRALALAARAPFHALHFACIIDAHAGIPAMPTKHVDADYVQRVHDELRSLIEQELRAHGTTGRVHYSIHARIGKPVEEILGVAKDVGADLIIVGSKGLTGLERLVLGSVAERVGREAQCTVEVARAKGYEYVPLMDVVEVQAHPHHRRAHRYSYEESGAMTRPLDWPLY